MLQWLSSLVFSWQPAVSFPSFQTLAASRYSLNTPFLTSCATQCAAMQAPFKVVCHCAQRIWCDAGMSTIAQTIAAWGLPSDAAQKLKEWLAHPATGFELEGLPDDDFWDLEDQHLQAADMLCSRREGQSCANSRNEVSVLGGSQST